VQVANSYELTASSLTEGKSMNEAFSALSDPTRREILRLLGDGDKSAGEIAAAFDMAWPSVSHHLNVLKKANLILAERDGQRIVYSLNTTVFHEFLQEVMAFFRIGTSGGKHNDSA